MQNGRIYATQSSTTRPEPIETAIIAENLLAPLLIELPRQPKHLWRELIILFVF